MFGYLWAKVFAGIFLGGSASIFVKSVTVLLIKALDFDKSAVDC